MDLQSPPRLDRLEDLRALKVDPGRLYSATHEEILGGWTTDIYFLKTRDVLRAAGRLDVPVTAEIFARQEGVFAGLGEVLSLLDRKGTDLAVEALPEGESFASKEVLVRIRGTYEAFGLYETVLLGMLASSTGWATAARRCVEAAEGLPVICFGSRHVHPAVAPVMERAAVVGGCVDASCILGAKLLGKDPKGTIPHAAILLAGDTVELARVYDGLLPEGEPRTVLVDTFKDEAEEALRVAEALGDRLSAVRLDTPANGRGDPRPGAGGSLPPQPGGVRSCGGPGVRRLESRSDSPPGGSGGCWLRGGELHHPRHAPGHDHGSEGSGREAGGQARPVARSVAERTTEARALTPNGRGRREPALLRPHEGLSSFWP